LVAGDRPAEQDGPAREHDQGRGDRAGGPGGAGRGEREHRDRAQLAPGGLLVISTPNRRSLPGARRWLAEHGVPGIRLNLAPVDEWQTWTDLEGHAASAGLVRVSRRGIFFRPGGRVGSQIGRLYRFAPVRRAEVAVSRTPLGRFGFYICLGFRAI